MTSGSSAVEAVRGVIAQVAASVKRFAKGARRNRFHDAFGVCDDCEKPMNLMPPDFETLRCPACGKNRPRRGGTGAPMAKAAPTSAPSAAQPAKPTRPRGLVTKPGAAPLAVQRETRASSTARPATKDPEGKTPLGRTRSKKPVYASGADATKYSDRDHADAAVLHVQAHLHHEKQARVHRAAADDGDGHWTRAEEHHQDGDRHAKLSEHHHELAGQHLRAAGLADTLDVDVSGEEAAVAKKPATAQSQREAKQALAGRSHHDHPGGLTDHDRDAYTRFRGVDG